MKSAAHNENQVSREVVFFRKPFFFAVFVDVLLEAMFVNIVVVKLC